MFVIVLKFMAHITVHLLFFISMETFSLLFLIDCDSWFKLLFVEISVLLFSISLISDKVFKITGIISSIWSLERFVAFSFSFRSSTWILLSIDNVLGISLDLYKIFVLNYNQKCKKSQKKSDFFLCLMCFCINCRKIGLLL